MSSIHIYEIEKKENVKKRPNTLGNVLMCLLSNRTHYKATGSSHFLGLRGLETGYNLPAAGDLIN